VPEAYAIFTVNIPQDGVYDVSLSAYPCLEGHTSAISVYANGLPLLVKEKLLLDESNVAVHSLNLRFGLNTLRYHVHSDSSLAFDYIKVKGALPLADRGATVNYEEIEAENSVFTGTKIGPNKTYTSLPSEASGRIAVNLNSGQYVEFAPTKPFNAIVVKFSIPNANGGIGQSAPLSLLINGQQTKQLNITSYWSWAYGTMNQYTRDPGAGYPHHFYDDIRLLLSTTYPAGTKVRVVAAAGIVYTIDLADFYQVPAPYTMPANYVSVADFGADPTGQKDAGGAFQNAFNTFQQKNAAGIWVPAGKYTFSYRLNLRDNMIIRGAGPWYTELYGRNVGFDGQHTTNSGVYDLAFLGQTNVRNDGESSSGVGMGMNNAQIQNVWIERDKCGMWLNGPFNALHISGVTIRNTFADGINFNIGAGNSMVEQTVVRNTGDDNLAMWANGGGENKNVFRFNTLSLPILANNIAIYGGSDNSATDNLCSETLLEGAGLQVGTRFGSSQLGGNTVFQRNTLVRTGSGDMYNPVNVEGAIWIYADSGPVNSPILFEDIIIQDSYFQAIEFFKGDVSNVNFTNIQVTGAKYVFDTLVSVDIYVQGMVATGITKHTLNNCQKLPFKVTQGSGNSGWDITDVGCEA